MEIINHILRVVGFVAIAGGVLLAGKYLWDWIKFTL
jgi:hypothetical protein